VCNSYVIRVLRNSYVVEYEIVTFDIMLLLMFAGMIRDAKRLKRRFVAQQHFDIVNRSIKFCALRTAVKIARYKNRQKQS